VLNVTLKRKLKQNKKTDTHIIDQKINFMSGVLFCNIIGYAALIASFIVPRFKFKDDRSKYAIGLTLASFSSTELFTAGAFFDISVISNQVIKV
jgi:hypothetical protein